MAEQQAPGGQASEAQAHGSKSSTGPAHNAEYLRKDYWDERFRSERDFEVIFWAM